MGIWPSIYLGHPNDPCSSRATGSVLYGIASRSGFFVPRNVSQNCIFMNTPSKFVAPYQFEAGQIEGAVRRRSIIDSVRSKFLCYPNKRDETNTFDHYQKRPTPWYCRTFNSRILFTYQRNVGTLLLDLCANVLDEVPVPVYSILPPRDSSSFVIRYTTWLPTIATAFWGRETSAGAPMANMLIGLSSDLCTEQCICSRKHWSEHHVMHLRTCTWEWKASTRLPVCNEDLIVWSRQWLHAPFNIYTTVHGKVLSHQELNPPCCSNMQSIWSWSSSSSDVGVWSPLTRSPSSRNRSAPTLTPFREAYVLNTFSIRVVFFTLKYVSSPVCSTSCKSGRMCITMSHQFVPRVKIQKENCIIGIHSSWSYNALPPKISHI